MSELQDLLTRAASVGGEFAAPAGDSLRSRARRRSRVRGAVAVGSVVVLVFALSVGLAWRGHRDSPVAAPEFDPSRLPGPTGPVVTAAELATYHWDALPGAPIALGDRSAASVVWTGSRLFVWGGSRSGGFYSDGALYDPAMRRWSELPPSPLSGRASAVAVFVNGKVIVWGGITGSGTQTDGAAFDPTSESWTELPPTTGVGGQQVGVAVGDDLVVLTSRPAVEPRTLHATAFDTDSGVWRSLPDISIPGTEHSLVDVQGLAVGSTLFVWATWSYVRDTSPATLELSVGVDTYALQSDTWHAVDAGAGQHTTTRQPLWTGSVIVLPGDAAFCGMCPHSGQPDLPIVTVDPLTGKSVTSSRGPTGATDGYAWTGGAVLAVGVTGTVDGDPDGIARSGAWDPATDRWTVLSPMPRAPGSDFTVIWAGDRALVWTGGGGVEFAP